MEVVIALTEELFASAKQNEISLSDAGVSAGATSGSPNFPGGAWGKPAKTLVCLFCYFSRCNTRGPPYQHHKLDARSSPHLFRGYSLTRCAYICTIENNDDIGKEDARKTASCSGLEGSRSEDSSVP
ncbi:unnamed protein product [Arabis nemorensis]|uniref:Uncharacterized protein n=1 Tax=Arabis nemorensis TaxID=586526 RepID=A0A565BR88_9BRAS|nr:unnamed protein product [Arabis nemorensis]